MEQTQKTQESGGGTNDGGNGFGSSSATTDGALSSSQPSLPPAQNPFAGGGAGSQNPFKTAAEVSQNSYMGGDGQNASQSQSQNPFSTGGGPVQVQRPVYNNNNAQVLAENPYIGKFKCANIAPAITTPILAITSAFCCFIFYGVKVNVSHPDKEGDGELEKYGPICDGGLVVSSPLLVLCFGVCYFECALRCVNVKPGCVLVWLILNGIISLLLFLHLIFLVVLFATLSSGQDVDDDAGEIHTFKISWDGFRSDSENSHSRSGNRRVVAYRLESTWNYIGVAALVIGIICLVLRVVSFGYVLYMRKSLVNNNTGVGGGGGVSYDARQYRDAQGGLSSTNGPYDPSYPPPPPYSQPQQLSTHTP